MEPRQGDRSLFGRLPHLEGRRHRPCKYEVPVQVHQEPWVKLEFGSQTPIIKARLQPRGRVALSKTAVDK